MAYKYSYNWRDSCIQTDKNESVEVGKKSTSCYISIKKVLNSANRKEDHKLYPFSGRITSNDVDTQLANVRHIGFEITDVCNLHCTYCAYGELYNNFDTRKGQKIEIEKAKRLIDFLVDKLNSKANKTPVNDVYISYYGGEPLLNFDFVQQMVDYTQGKQSSFVRFHYMMTTNAVYLRKYISFLSQYNFSLTISLDGSKENNGHRKFIDDKPSYDIVYDNLKYVQDNYPDYFKEKIGFNAVMHNLNNLQSVFSFIYHEFGKIPYFSEINPAGANPEKKKEFEDIITIKASEKDEKIVDEMKKVLGLEFGELRQLQRFIFRYSGNFYDNYNELLVTHKRITHLPSATCMPFSKRIFMTVNNKIFPCEKIGHQYVLGEVTDTGVKIDIEQVANKYNGYYDALQKQCDHCYNKLHCTQCLFSITDLDNHPVCEYFSDEQSFDKYVRKNMEILADQPQLYRRIMKEILIQK